MATTTDSSQLFDCLTDERLKDLVAKLRRLPTGSEFERRVEEGIATTVEIEDRKYADIIEEHGDLIGYTDSETEDLPWWLKDFEWTVTAEPMDSITFNTASSIGKMENYPNNTTRIENILLSNAESVIKGLDAFATLEEVLTEAMGLDSSELTPTGDDVDKYGIPEKLFVVPERGRIDTSDSFKKWMGYIINLCPPASPELTACLRVNANIEWRHAKEILDEEELQRLTELKIFESTKPKARAYNEKFYNSLVTLLEITLPFDLEIEIGNDKSALTDLQYAYYRGWAQDTERVSNEQQWLRMARKSDNISDDEEYRFAEYAFQLPIKILNSHVVYEDQQETYANKESKAIGRLLEEFGHPLNDD